jgi:hypothetical protein
MGTSFSPPEAHAPLVDDANRVLAAAITFQSLKAIAWWDAQVFQRPSAVQQAQLNQSAIGDVHGQAFAADTVPDLFGLAIGKALDHARL